MFSRAIPLCLVLALALCCASARAANPKVTLRLENVTAAEAIEQLSSASAVFLELSGEVPKGPERASFDWKDVTLATAMRQLCERFKIQPRRRWEGGYTLF